MPLERIFEDALGSREHHFAFQDLLQEVDNPRITSGTTWGDLRRKVSLPIIQSVSEHEYSFGARNSIPCRLDEVQGLSTDLRISAHVL